MNQTIIPLGSLFKDLAEKFQPDESSPFLSSLVKNKEVIAAIEEALKGHRAKLSYNIEVSGPAKAPELSSDELMYLSMLVDAKPYGSDLDDDDESTRAADDLFEDFERYLSSTGYEIIHPPLHKWLRTEKKETSNNDFTWVSPLIYSHIGEEPENNHWPVCRDEKFLSFVEDTCLRAKRELLFEEYLRSINFWEEISKKRSRESKAKYYYFVIENMRSVFSHEAKFKTNDYSEAKKLLALVTEEKIQAYVRAHVRPSLWMHFGFEAESHELEKEVGKPVLFDSSKTLEEAVSEALGVMKENKDVETLASMGKMPLGASGPEDIEKYLSDLSSPKPQANLSDLKKKPLFSSAKIENEEDFDLEGFFENEDFDPIED